MNSNIFFSVPSTRIRDLWRQESATLSLPVWDRPSELEGGFAKQKDFLMLCSRYPIHFHITGNMNTSYVRGNAIHHSNNRACTLHDISNTTVEHNVAYNIKGLTFFLEDGVEMYNTIQYNLAVFTRMSNSLLNPDINPASFWIVNPNNKFRHNSCAGVLIFSRPCFTSCFRRYPFVLLAASCQGPRWPLLYTELLPFQGLYISIFFNWSPLYV